MDPLLFIVLLSLILNGFRVLINKHHAPVPKALMRLKLGIEKGKPNRRLWHTLRAKQGFDDHYRKVPGRMACTVLPLRVNGEDVWQLRVGFRTTAADKCGDYISITVYANGQIYDV